MAVKSPRLENNWMRSSSNPATASSGTSATATTFTSMMMVDHGQTTIVMADLKELLRAAGIGIDNGGSDSSSGMQQCGGNDILTLTAMAASSFS